MEKSELLIKKQQTKKFCSKNSKNSKLAEMTLNNKKKFPNSKRGLTYENPKKKLDSLNYEEFDSGITHLEFLKEKNSLARKRLLDLQKRLLELKSTEKPGLCFEGFKLPQVFDQVRNPETLDLIQKYSSVNLRGRSKNII